MLPIAAGVAALLVVVGIVAGVDGEIKHEWDAAGYVVGKVPVSDKLELFARGGYGSCRIAEAVLPRDPDGSYASSTPRFSAALMELGALVCTAARPACEVCPVADRCAWRAARS